VEQETLDSPQATHNPLDHSLWKRFVDNGQVVHSAWLRACAEGGAYVGTCRECGGYLKPRHPETVGRRTDYEATCVSCSHGVLAPDGKTLHRSARRNERPGGE
jgi:hypothetical protein